MFSYGVIRRVNESLFPGALDDDAGSLLWWQLDSPLVAQWVRRWRVFGGGKGG